MRRTLLPGHRPRPGGSRDLGSAPQTHRCRHTPVMRVGRLLAAAALLVAAGCAATPDDAEDGDMLGEPPTVVVAGDGTEPALQAPTWCWRGATAGGCAGGAPPPHPPSTGPPALAEITHPHADR